MPATGASPSNRDRSRHGAAKAGNQTRGPDLLPDWVGVEAVRGGSWACPPPVPLTPAPGSTPQRLRRIRQHGPMLVRGDCGQ